VIHTISHRKAKKKLPKEIQKRVEEWKFTTGAAVLCLVAYSDGQDVRTFQLVHPSPLMLQSTHAFSSIESPPVVRHSFTTSCSDWKAGTYELFRDWAGKQFGVKELDTDDEAEVPVDMQKAKDIAFEKNDNGDFVLPPKIQFNRVKQKQRVIRGFIGALYR
jgi:hypothetical protein